jgi:hypothetical protein
LTKGSAFGARDEVSPGSSIFRISLGAMHPTGSDKIAQAIQRRPIECPPGLNLVIEPLADPLIARPRLGLRETEARVKLRLT